MMRLRYLVPILGLTSLSLVAVSCTVEEGTDDPAAGAGGVGGGSAGEAAGGTTASPEAGAGGASAGACATDGSGTVVLEIEGLPDGVGPDVTLSGSRDYNLTEVGPLEDLEAGTYEVSAARVYDADPIVRTVFEPKVATTGFCLASGDSQTVKVTYSPIASSNKLWLSTGLDDEIAGFASSAIGETATADATVAINTRGAGSLAFDRDGNLWAVGPTIGEDMLVRIPASKLGASGTREPDVAIKIPEIECFPAINHLAFAPDGSLWLSACDDHVYGLKAEDLSTSGDKIAFASVAGQPGNQGIAFDKDGNLWVAGATAARFDAFRLSDTDTDPPDLSLTITAKLDSTVLGPDEILFDKAGNLWGVAGSYIFQVAESALADTGDKPVKANVSFAVDVQALPGTPAFDESNSLWVSLTSGKFGQFSPTQLSKSSNQGSPTTPAVVITSDNVGQGPLPLSFFPAPEGLPLYHSLPAQ